MNNTSRLTLCLLAAAPAVAVAQSTVQLGGLIDTGIHVDSGTVSGTVKSVSSGQHDANRLRFSVLEDLGGGWKAGVNLEGGFASDTGAGANNPPGVAAGGFSFGRLAALSVGSDSTGYLSLGRQYTPMWAISAGPANDPFGAGMLGGIATLYTFAVRASNSVVYTYGYTAQTTRYPAPLKGLGVMLMAAPGEATAPAPTNSGNQLGANVSYGDGTWWVGYGYHQIKGSSPAVSATAPVGNTPTLKAQTLAASYQFPIGRVHLGVNTGRNGLSGVGAVDRMSWHTGMTMTLGGPHAVNFIVGRANDRTATNADLTTFQIGYDYSLSKRTMLYTGFGVIDNSAASAAGLAGATAAYAPGSKARALVGGVRHVF